jgi:hypothetical protein
MFGYMATLLDGSSNVQVLKANLRDAIFVIKNVMVKQQPYRGSKKAHEYAGQYDCSAPRTIRFGCVTGLDRGLSHQA